MHVVVLRDSRHGERDKKAEEYRCNLVHNLERVRCKKGGQRRGAYDQCGGRLPPAYVDVPNRDSGNADAAEVTQPIRRDNGNSSSCSSMSRSMARAWIRSCAAFTPRL